MSGHKPEEGLGRSLNDTLTGWVHTVEMEQAPSPVK